MENNIDDGDIKALQIFIKKNKNKIFTQSKKVKELEEKWSKWLGVKYSTFVNCVANSWDLLLYSLQQQNITKKIKRTSLPEVQEESEKYENIEETIEDIVADPAIMDPPPIKEVDENDVQEVQDEEKPEPEPPIKQLKMKENIEYSISDI